MIRMRIAGLTMDTNTRTPLVVLQALDSDLLLPLWIGPTEAMALSIELGHTNMPRPLPHALIGNILNAFGAELQSIHINAVRNDIFFAELRICKEEHEYLVDCRPSDALVLALRHKAPIFANESVILQAAESNRLAENGYTTARASRDSESSMMEQAFENLQVLAVPAHAVQALYSPQSGEKSDEEKTDTNLTAINKSLQELENNLENLTDDEKAQLTLLQMLDPESHNKM